MNKIVEKQRELEVIEEADIIVVGGGPAGVAAATSAAELGNKVILIEKNGFFGGANVSGMSGTIGGLFSASETGDYKQIVSGFAGRFYNELLKNDGIVAKFPFGGTVLCPFNPLKWKEVADRFVTESGVKIYFHTLFVDTIVNEDRIEAIIVENKEGRFAMKAKRFIDCSGDGDVATRSGVPYRFGDGSVQATTMVFRLGNIDWDKALKLSKHEIEEKVNEALETGEYNLPRKHIFIFPQPDKGEGLMNVTRVITPDNKAPNAAFVNDLTYSELEGRKQIREYERFLRNYIPGFEESHVIESASEIGIRQSRTIECKYTLKNEDVINARKFDHAIARSAWPIEVHQVGGTKVHTLYDDYYEIPYESLVPLNLSNLIIAGRCISAEHEALASCRVVAQCMEEGLAAAIASSLSIKYDCNYIDVPIKRIQDIMRDKGSLI